MGIGDDEDDLLACSEEICGSPSTSGSSCISSSSSGRSCVPDLNLVAIGVDRYGDEAQALRNLAAREPAHSPGPQYSSTLKSQHLVCEARSNAVDWMIKVCNVYAFSPGTVALSVNYLDRYLGMELRHKVWKAWMIELLSIACLSLAAKMEETFVPLLQDLQVEGLEHRFERVTIQRMEVSVMKLLEWRLNSVTTFSFIGEILRSLELQHHLKMVAWNRIKELLLGTLAEIAFLDFSPSLIAVSATVCALEETVPLQAQAFKRVLLEMILVEEARFKKCYQILEELLVDPIIPVPSSNQVLLASSSEGQSFTESRPTKKRIGSDCGDGASKKKRSP